MRLFDAGMPASGEVVVHDRVWTVANVVTFVRLAGLPLFVWLLFGPDAYGLAFAVLVVVGTTDWVDGYIARRFDQVTRLGRALDPLIDRMLLATAAVSLAIIGFLPVLLLVLIVLRDVLLLSAAYLRYRGIPPFGVSRAGKFATACLLIGVPGFLLGNMDWSQARFWLLLGTAFAVVGTIAYYVAGIQYVRIARAVPPGQVEPVGGRPPRVD